MILSVSQQYFPKYFPITNSYKPLSLTENATFGCTFLFRTEVVL